MNVGDRTCAACDCPLGGSVIRVPVGGESVEVCSSACADALNEAWAARLPQRWALGAQQASLTVRSIETASGRISYAEAGSGPVALFVHGMLLNRHFWRHQLTQLSDIRRCIAVDILAHGETEIEPNQDVSVIANANMLKEMLDALQIDRVDLIGNHSGGGISQIFAALHPERARTLTLTNCGAHGSWPCAALGPFLGKAAAAGGLGDALNEMLADKTIYRSPSGLGLAYERPDSVSDEDIEIYLRPLLCAAQRTRDLQRFLAAFDSAHTRAIEPRLKQLYVPTLIVWGTDDVYFPVKWAYWLAETIPGAKPPVELPGARVFFPEERSELFNQLLRDELLAG
jgi:pimeloyl-ACP methyl ester carboxylesterase